MRSAISPRLAIRIFLNIVRRGPPRQATRARRRCGASFDDEERLAELDRLAVLAQDLPDRAGCVRLDLVHDLHRLDDADRLADPDGAADLDEGVGARAGRAVERADHRRLDDLAGDLRRSGLGTRALARRERRRA